LLDIQPFYESNSGTWTYLVADTVTNAAAIIDPVWVYDPVSGMTDESFIEQVLTAAGTSAYRVHWVLETHAHADHLTAAQLIRDRTGARIACGKGIRAVQENFSRVFNLPELPVDGSQFDRLLEEGDVIELGGLEICVMNTPGHTADSLTYRVEDAAFVGDTLFRPSFGTARCDFPGGDAGALYESISRLYQLPADTRLYLCHDYPKEGSEPVCMVTVEDSKRDNIHLRGDTTKKQFVSMRIERDSQLGLPKLILPSLQVNIQAGAPPAAESNGASYLKTPFNQSIEDLIRGEKP
jgi:glyoxylase-like metal-dependent hydrolase (beta-lactamase superfamily II)